MSIERNPNERRLVRFTAAAFAAAIVAGIALTVVYATGGYPELEGLLLGVALGGLGAGLIVWGKHLLLEGKVVEPRAGRQPPEVLEAAQEDLERGTGQITGRRTLLGLLAGGLAALGLAAVFPIRSLGPSPGRALFQTAWRRGLRVVDALGNPVRVDTLEVGSVITVFPEGHVGSADAQTLLIRVEPGTLRLPEGREAWVPRGNIAYSKICTHAGCPVGLYRETTHLLLCPCHQSTFNVLEGAVPVFGPAARPLPQLPLGVDPAGFLIALGDFPEPTGPTFWEVG